MLDPVVIALSLAAAQAYSLVAPHGDGEVRSAIVNHDDLDLKKPRDVARLEHRLRIAIRELCGSASSADLEGKTAIRKCRKVTRSSFDLSRATAGGERAAGTQSPGQSQ